MQGCIPKSVVLRKVPSLCFKVIVFISRFFCSVSLFNFELQREALGCLLTRQRHIARSPSFRSGTRDRGAVHLLSINPLLGRRASFLLADGRWSVARASCYCREVAIGLDGRPSRPAANGKFSVAGKVATAARFFSAKGKPLFQPSIQPHTRVLRVLVGKFPRP